jgi:GTP cyclohydrolase II
MPADLPSHASPVIAPQPRPAAHYLNNWDDLNDGGLQTPGLPSNLLSPAFTPPATPGLSSTSGTSTPSLLLQHRLTAEPKSTPVDTLLDLPKGKAPRLLERLPVVECVVRARIPTVSGAEMFLHLYQNDVDNKEHLAIVFGDKIRSRSLDREREGESEMDRMIRGAYVGRLRPGRVSSRTDGENRINSLRAGKRKRAGSALKHVSTPGEQNGTRAGVERAPALDVKPAQTPEEGALQSARQDLEDSLQAEGGDDAEDDQDADEPDTSLPSGPEPKPPLVRIHSECYTGETAWSARCDCGEQLDEAARLMSLPSTSTSPSATGGVIVYLRQEGRGIGLSEKLKAYNLQDLGSDTVEANLLLRHPADARSYGLATAILVDLGCGGDSGIRLLTNNPEKVRAVEGPGREVRVRERVAMVPLSWKSGGRKGIHSREIERYLETKIGKMGHMINEDE